MRTQVGWCGRRPSELGAYPISVTRGRTRFKKCPPSVDAEDMRARFNDRWLLIAAALLVGAIVLWRGSLDAFWSDFPAEALPSYMALHGGDFVGFVDLTPTYRGFVLLIGGPMTLIASVLGFDDFRTDATPDLEEIFAATAIPGLLAIAWLTTALACRARSLGAPFWHALLTLVVTAPIAYLALLFGHPEDLLAASAAVGAVLAARAGRVGAAIVLLLLASLCKQWAVLAILPAALAAPRANLKIALLGGTGAAVALGALHVLGGEGMNGGLTSVGDLFHGHQWLYPLGVEPAAGIPLPTERASTVAPAWLSLVIHPLIIALAVPLSAAWWWRARRGARNRDDALALLALLFLERCALDPWNIHYYHLPMLLALLAWEIRRGRTVPTVTLLASLAVWGSFVTYTVHYGAGPYLLYLAWTVPLACFLVYQLYVLPHRSTVRNPLRASGAQAAGAT
jgi:hypothetical protein